MISRCILSIYILSISVKNFAKNIYNALKTRDHPGTAIDLFYMIVNVNIYGKLILSNY